MAKRIQLILHGLSEETLDIEIDKTMTEEKSLQVIDGMVTNVVTYYIKMLKLQSDNLFVYAAGEFYPIAHFKAFGAVLTSTDPIIIIWVDFNIKEHRQAQEELLQRYGLYVSQISMDESRALCGVAIGRDSYSNLYLPLDIRIDVTTDNGLIPISEAPSQNGGRGPSLVPDPLITRLTHGISVDPSSSARFVLSSQNVQNLNPEHVLSLTTKTGAFSLLRFELVSRPNEKMKPPVYFSDQRLKEFSSRAFDTVVSGLKGNSAFVIDSSGDLRLTDQKIISIEKAVLPEVAKKLAKNILLGRGVKAMSMPVTLMDTLTQLQTYAKFFSPLASLHRAVAAADDLSRLKHVLTYAITSFYYGFSARKPFNPYIGETFQANYEDGTQISVEHISHNPSRDLIFLDNSRAGFRLHGNLESEGKLSNNTMEVGFKGVISVQIGSDLIYVELPIIENTGILYGERKAGLKGSVLAYQPKTNTKALVTFGGTKRNDELFGGIYTNSIPVQYNEFNTLEFLFPFSDKFSAKYPQKEKGFGQLIQRVSGSWQQKIDINGEILWTNSENACRIIIDKDVLPSDWRFREDLLWLVYDNTDQAQLWKDAIEKRMREDREMRNKILDKSKGKLKSQKR